MKLPILLGAVLALAALEPARAEDGFAAFLSGLGVTPEYVGQQMARAEVERIAARAPNEVKRRLSEAEHVKFAALADFACRSRSGMIYASRNILVVQGGIDPTACAGKNIVLIVPASILGGMPEYSFIIDPQGGIQAGPTRFQVVEMPGGEFSDDVDIPLNSAPLQGALQAAIDFWMAYESPK